MKVVISVGDAEAVRALHELLAVDTGLVWDAEGEGDTVLRLSPGDVARLVVTLGTWFRMSGNSGRTVRLRVVPGPELIVTAATLEREFSDRLSELVGPAPAPETVRVIENHAGGGDIIMPLERHTSPGPVLRPDDDWPEDSRDGQEP